MSIRTYAAHLGVSPAAVANWERRGEQTRMRTETQQILDTDLARAPEDVQQRFTVLLPATRQHEPITSLPSEDLDLHWSPGIPRRRHRDGGPPGRGVEPSEGWDETMYHLRAQWHLLVQNDKLFGPEYAIIGVTGQLTLVDRLLVDVPERLRPTLIRLAAQYAESAAWLSQSLDDPAAGRGWIEKALAWANQIADPTMTTWATYRSSQHWLIAGQPQRAVKYAETSLRHDKQLPAPMRAAIRVQQAHAAAASGRHREAMWLLDDAHRWAADRGPGKPEGEHGSYCTSGYIEVYRGICLRLAHRPSHAITVLDEAIPSIPPLHRQDFATALVSKAAAHVDAHQPELAAVTARTALPIARRAGSRRILHQLAHVGTAVEAHRELADVGGFLHDLAEIA